MNLPHKRIACILTSFLIIGVANAAQPAPAQPVVPNHLTVAVAYAPKTLDPAHATDAASARLLQLTHPALLKWDARYRPAPHAASCAQENLTHVTCTLPANRTFTDGAPFTAPAVRQWFAMLQADPRSPFAGTLKNVSVTAPTVQTLAFTLPSPTLSFMATLVEVPLANPSNTAAGMGPYRLEEQDALGNVTLSLKDPQTLRSSDPQTLTFLYVADPTTRLLKLKKGEVDVVLNDLSPELYTWAQQQGFATVGTPGTSYTYLGLNFRNDLLANPAVREALTLSLNRPALRRYLLGNLAAPASTLLPPAHPAAWQAQEEAFDPLMAENLLDDENLLPGLDNTRFTLTLLTSTDAFSQRVAQAIQHQFGKVGVNLHLRPTEWAAFYDAVAKGQFDLVLLTWTGEQQPAFYAQAFHSANTPPKGFNRGRFANPQVDLLADRITAAPTREEQEKAAVELQQLLADQRPYIPLYRRHHTLVALPTLTGCTIPPSGAYTGLLACRLQK